MKHILNTKQFSKKEVNQILSVAGDMENICRSNKVGKQLQNKIVACVFFEPSTRTRLSFETAATKLGANIISMENAAISSSAHKGETIEDTVRMLNCYADLIVIRHPQSGAVEVGAKVSTKPIINAGDGNNQHPTQGFLDLYTIQKEKGRLTNLNIGFGGDLLNSRTVKSLLPLLRLYEGNKFYFISPKELELPRELIQELKDAGVVFEELNNLEDKISDLDVLYMTRVQKERFANTNDYERVKDLFILKNEYLNDMKKDAIIMHPLPKVNEIDKEVDIDSRAAYFRQAQNGLYVRMALLLYVFGL
ncbi:aspartate carbamoyltransferase [Candidatus Nomurabacteria bacterium CG10_big_fil_rev_8_21_14_0_10_35_16]|uniref:Aspartate carbamoyltransferase n=1 Tax=Candidatus Nomurabacteria bacterium CG10_big_fil_rev_8_21_14_0_10_35_16 TaxID=1974731 RepID=A0A2H0TBZ1_9BACT|nr:MAG: aspartate carbamoyltransferase [Candidatus Nomurabacteria bacterium CG10_big_fil_rev_8_21_14_0_10_35_16]